MGSSDLGLQTPSFDAYYSSYKTFEFMKKKTARSGGLSSKLTCFFREFRDFKTPVNLIRIIFCLVNKTF